MEENIRLPSRPFKEMKKQLNAELIENRILTPDVRLIRLSAPEEIPARPGQFVNLRIDGQYLRRPISVCDAQDGILTLVFKIVGKGTRKMAESAPGTVFDLLAGLGNGYDLGKAGNNPVLLGGGAGVPPMYFLAKELMSRCDSVRVILGFNTADEIFFEKEFAGLGAEVRITTVDGSYGIRGFATDALPEDYSYFYTCGPEPMLKAVYRAAQTSGQFSFEERMGCGFGACMGCTCRTLTGFKRICREGPVLEKEEILW